MSPRFHTINAKLQTDPELAAQSSARKLLLGTILCGPLQNIDLSNFELLAHMVHSGDSELQARKVKDIAAKYSHPAV